VDPVFLAGLGIEAIDEAAEVRGEKQAIFRIDAHGGNAAVDFLVVPDQASLGDVPGLRRIHAHQPAHAFAVLGILPEGHIHAVLVKDGRSR